MAGAAVEMVAFFESAEADQDDWSANSYVAGLRSADGRPAGIRLVVPAEMVEPVVLAKAQLSLALNPDGTFTLHADGLSHDALDAASQSVLATQLLGSLFENCLDSSSLAMQDDPVSDLTALREQLAKGLSLVDRALAGLRAK